MAKKGVSSHSQTHDIFANHKLLWFRVWIGFLIGVYATYSAVLLFVLTNTQLRVLWDGTMAEGIAFVLLPLVCIWFFIQISQQKRNGIYVVATLSGLGILYQLIFMNADLGNTILMTLLFSIISLAFIIPEWRAYQ